MSDLISRHEVIKTLCERRCGNKSKGCPSGFCPESLAVDCIPAAQQWIPCSERLPEIGEHYVSESCIVYCSNGAYGFAELEENFFGQVGWNCERDDEYHEPLGEVIAWMPLPEPYKEEKK